MKSLELDHATIPSSHLRGRALSRHNTVLLEICRTCFRNSRDVEKILSVSKEIKTPATDLPVRLQSGRRSASSYTTICEYQTSVCIHGALDPNE